MLGVFKFSSKIAKKVIGLSPIGSKLLPLVEKIEEKVEEHYDRCSKLRNRLLQVATASPSQKVAELKRRLLLKYYGVDDEGALTYQIYSTGKNNLKDLGSREE